MVCVAVAVAAGATAGVVAVADMVYIDYRSSVDPRGPDRESPRLGNPPDKNDSILNSDG